MKPDVEKMTYRLERIRFQNGWEMGFDRAQMLYNPTERCVAVMSLMTRPQLEAAFSQFAGDKDSAPIRTIFYRMVVPGYADLKFYHPLQRGSDVDLMLSTAGTGGPMLRLVQLDGRPIFSKAFTLRGVSNGQIPSDKAVWQFHGYKHDH